MSSIQLVEKLKALSLAHEKISGTQGLVKQQSESIKQKEASLALLGQKQASLDAEIKHAQKEIDEIDLELASTQEQEDKLQKKLKTLKKVKETTALEKELALLARQRFDLERALEAAWNTFTGLKQSIASAKIKLNQEEAAIKSELAACAKTASELKNKLSSSEVTWNEALSQIPTEWQTRYARMLNSVANPIVAINNSVCGACFYTVVEKDLHRIKAGDILACRSCYRLLYNGALCATLDTPERQASY
jgi:predicted  nucleic acid-binding Zn-ribbon protein